MVSSLLDELPCLVDEADELMARLSCLMTLLRGHDQVSTFSTSMAMPQDSSLNPSRQDLESPLSPRYSPPSSLTSHSMAELRQVLHNIDLDAILKFFARHYLTLQSMAVEKLNANLPVKDAERNALYTFATCTHQLMNRLHHWQQTAWESLSRFSTATSSNESSCLLTFESHPQLTRLVLATVAKYVKVNLLWTSFNGIPGLLALYSFLHSSQILGDALTPHTVFSPLDHTDHRVRDFVLHFHTAPLLAIQHDFHQVSGKGESLAALALSCFEQYEVCRDLPKLRQQGVFDLETLVSGAYASHSCLPHLVDASDVADCVICVVLCVPHQLHATNPTHLSSPDSLTPSPSLWDFMEIIVRDRLVLSLHRNHVVNLHDLLYLQLTSSLTTAALTTISTSSPAVFGTNRSTMPMKKLVKALSKHALKNCGANHRQHRQVALWLVRNCVQLMQHNPGVVAPSFPLLVAALAIARDEVEWAISHGVFNADSYKAPLLPNHIKLKHLQRVAASFSGSERDIADLLTHSHRLRGLIEHHSHLLTEYYHVFLTNGDADGIAYTIHKLLGDHESRGDMKPLLEGFLDRDRYRVDSSSSPRITWVREWRQASAHLTARAQSPLLAVLRAQMERAVSHTNYISLNVQLIEHASNFSKCWWFHDVVFEQSFQQTLTTAPSSAVGLVEILSSLAQGAYTLDGIVEPEEATQQSVQMLQHVDRMRMKLVHQLESGLEAIVERDITLQRDERSIALEGKCEPVEAKSTASSRRLSSFSRGQSSQVGQSRSAELRLASPTASVLNRNSDSTNKTLKRTQVNGDEQWVALVRALLNHVGHHQDGNMMRKALAQRVQTCFTRFLRGFVVFLTQGIGAVTLRCSIGDACSQLQCFLRAVQTLFGANKTESKRVSLGEELEVALRNVLVSECSPSTSILPQGKMLLDWINDSPQVSEKELKRWSLLDRLTWLYVVLVAKKCHLSSSSSQPISSSSLVLASVRKRCFLLAPGSSGELDPRDYTSCDALEHLVALIGFAGVEFVCSSIANLLVTQTLKLRSFIETEHAVLTSMDKDDTIADDMAASSHVRVLDDIATHLVRIGTTVFLLQLVHGHSRHDTKDAWGVRVAPRILRELQQDSDRRATWIRLLPVACSLVFHSSVWKRTRYLSSLETTDTNAHMMGLAMGVLLSSCAGNQSAYRCAVAALKRAATGATNRSKMPLQVDGESPTRPILEALELLVTTAAPDSGQTMDAHSSSGDQVELALKRLLPRSILALHSN